MEQSDQPHLHGEGVCVCVCVSGSALHPGATQQGGSGGLGDRAGRLQEDHGNFIDPVCCWPGDRLSSCSGWDGGAPPAQMSSEGLRW